MSCRPLTAGPIHRPFNAGHGDFLYSKMPTADSTVDFDTQITDKYGAYLFEISALTTDTDDQTVAMRVGTGSSPTYQASAYDYAALSVDASGGSPSVAGQSQGQILLTRNAAGSDLGNAAGESLSGWVIMSAPRDSTSSTLFTYHTAYRRAGDGFLHVVMGGGLWATGTVVTAVRFFMTTAGDFDGGTVSMYGIRTG